MTPFLKLAANDIYKKFNGKLHNTAIVFPNKRAGLFFNEYLLQCCGHPMWSPQYITISELFRQCSDAVIGDSIMLVNKLYKEYKRHTGSNETIDSFYHWGELLIKDFDDIDKNIADAKKIFSNLKELRMMGNATSALDKEQAEAIEQFFNNFKPQHESELKRRFLQIWQVLGDIYEQFKKQLRNDGIAYEGMLYRDIIESDTDIVLPYENYVFIGFNALNKVESKLFEKVQEQGKALFYWDYDESYVHDKHHEAGRFMRSNLKKFPNALQGNHFDNIKNKNINIVDSATDSIQLRYASRWIEENIGENEVETALILCDESKLESVYHIIPPVVKERNITMGYPLSHTPVYDLVRLLVNIQTIGYDNEQQRFTLSAVHDLLNHPYIRMNCEQAADIDKYITEKRISFPPTELLHADALLASIFTRHTDNALWIASIGDIMYRIANKLKSSQSTTPQESSDIYNELYLEAILKVFTQTQRFISLLSDGELAMQQSTLGSLFMRVLSSQNMPFHGEPVIGMQIMGLLETRNLDFENIIFISANEGNLPQKSTDSSFIPYNIRRAFGLTLSEHRDSIYAYNFYRLLQRARNITIVYNSNTDNSTRGECSRYILQLMADGLCTEKTTLSARQKTTTTKTKAVTKTKEIIDILRKKYDHTHNKKATTLSPSALNCYLKCPLSFFYRYVMRLNAQQEYTTEIKNNDFGNIFHKAAELFYGDKQRLVERGDILPYIEKDALLYEFIDKAFHEEYFKSDAPPIYNGEQYINREVAHHFLKRLLKIDAAHAPFQYLGSEKEIYFTLPIELESHTMELRIGGRIDRMDIKGDTLEIIDYKTGGEEDKPQDLSQIFALKGKNMGYIFQVLLYCVAAIESGKARKASPSLIYIHSKSSTQRTDCIVKLNGTPITDAAPLKEEFISLLKEKIKEIFNPDTPFAPTCDESHCQWCDFKRLCNK